MNNLWGFKILSIKEVILEIIHYDLTFKDCSFDGIVGYPVDLETSIFLASCFPDSFATKIRCFQDRPTVKKMRKCNQLDGWILA